MYSDGGSDYGGKGSAAMASQGQAMKCVGEEEGQLWHLGVRERWNGADARRRVAAVKRSTQWKIMNEVVESMSRSWSSGEHTGACM